MSVIFSLFSFRSRCRDGREGRQFSQDGGGTAEATHRAREGSAERGAAERDERRRRLLQYKYSKLAAEPLQVHRGEQEEGSTRSAAKESGRAVADGRDRRDVAPHEDCDAGEEDGQEAGGARPQGGPERDDQEPRDGADGLIE